MKYTYRYFLPYESINDCLSRLRGFHSKFDLTRTVVLCRSRKRGILMHSPPSPSTPLPSSPAITPLLSTTRRREKQKIIYGTNFCVNNLPYPSDCRRGEVK